MTGDSPYELLRDPVELSACQGWTEEVYRDFLALNSGSMSETTFREKYVRRGAVLVLDIAGFTATAMHYGELPSLLRILHVQSICIPILKALRAEVIRCFADDIVAVFPAPEAALDAALDIHERIEDFSSRGPFQEYPPQCGIGIGYGDMFRIGPNLAQGDEMNRASKLGEDIARGSETLLTERAFEALRHREDVIFEPQSHDDRLFAYYEARRRDSTDSPRLPPSE